MLFTAVAKTTVRFHINTLRWHEHALYGVTEKTSDK